MKRRLFRGKRSGFPRCASRHSRTAKKRDDKQRPNGLCHRNGQPVQENQRNPYMKHFVRKIWGLCTFPFRTIKYYSCIAYRHCKRWFISFFSTIFRRWIISSFILIILLSAIFYFAGFQKELEVFSVILMKLITPYSVVLGVVLGYPLLKKRLMEKYISKRFEIILDANSNVRKKCLAIQVKYPVKYISTQLTFEHVSEILADLISIRQESLDANPEVYKYSDLVYQSVKRLHDRCKNNRELLSQFYTESFDLWMHEQIQQIFDCSKSIIQVPEGELSSKPRLSKMLSPFVTENQLVEIRGLSTSINHYHTSALLVLFYGINNRTIPEDNFRFFSDCYMGAPSPSPLARIMFANNIYMPPILKSPRKIIFDYGYISLIGFKRKRKTELGSGISKSYYIFIYHNISDLSFIYGTVNKMEDLSDYQDSYLDEPFNIENISKFEKNGEYLLLTIDVEFVSANFATNKKRLENKFYEEISKN